jgi:hypothetical protein
LLADIFFSGCRSIANYKIIAYYQTREFRNIETFALPCNSSLPKPNPKLLELVPGDV